MPEAYIVEAVRTPVGKKNGGLAAAHPADMGAHVLTELLDRAGVDPAAVEDVVFGCLDTLGPQAGDIARTAWLAAGLPEEVPGTTIDRQCGSSQQALHFAAQGVMSGTQDVVVAGGVQNMSQIPIGAAFRAAAVLLRPRHDRESRIEQAALPVPVRRETVRGVERGQRFGRHVGA
jgi:acetyl-CoA C-acetyltransferase